MQIVDLQDDNVAERSVITKRETFKTDSWVHGLIDLLHGQNESDFQLAVMFCNIILSFSLSAQILVQWNY